MIKKIDIYIIKKFLGTFVFAIILFSAIAVIIDLVEKVDDIIEKQVPIKYVITDYYINFIPWISTLLSPLFIFISVIYFTSRMASNTEIVAILGSGVSFYRLLIPYFVSAAILAMALFYANNYLVPKANHGRIEFEKNYLYPYKKMSERNIHMQLSEGVFLYMETYNKSDSLGYKLSLEKMENGKLKTKLRANRAKWKENEGVWEIQDYYIRTFDQSEEKITTGVSLDTALGITPADFEQKLSYKEAMTTPELNEYIFQAKKRGGQDIEYYEVEKHRRTADSFTTFILTLIGVSVASRKIRGGLGLHIMFGLLVAASYIIFMRFSTTFSTNGNLPPVMGVWIPNIIYGFFGLILLKKAPK